MKNETMEIIKILLEKVKLTPKSLSDDNDILDSMKQILKDEKLRENTPIIIDELLEIIENIKNPPLRAIIEFCEAQITSDKTPFQNVFDFCELIKPQKNYPIETVNDFLKTVKLPENYPIFLKIFYRGHSNEEFKFIPTVFRDKFLGFEQKIYYEVLRECASDFYDNMSELEILVKMQHYGVPTRILDVTSNPLIALYFACCSNINKDGAVWIIPANTGRILNFDNKILNWISCLPKKNTDTLSNLFVTIDFIHLIVLAHQKKIKLTKDLLKLIKEFNEKEYKCLCQQVAEVSDKTDFNFPSFDEILNMKDPPNLNANLYASHFYFSRFLMKYLFLPKLNNPRIIAQQGAFIIFSGNGKIEDNAHTYGSCRGSDYRRDYTSIDDYSDKIIIPASSKTNILKELEFIGISKGRLFPELDKYSEYIKEKYMI